MAGNWLKNNNIAVRLSMESLKVKVNIKTFNLIIRTMATGSKE